ncbi:hypothetical protein AVEN_181606-1 [Araneus ventricosus]|uniref:Uncharacterized protein n=1 Tax=Araneus ventricosus TaxID=182803 RepID=A0A4Y2CLH4_ARAVE|nr:hypothetical protein AVEN_181606-1 [Araneus ventricosus]
MLKILYPRPCYNAGYALSTHGFVELFKLGPSVTDTCRASTIWRCGRRLVLRVSHMLGTSCIPKEKKNQGEGVMPARCRSKRSRYCSTSIAIHAMHYTRYVSEYRCTYLG